MMVGYYYKELQNFKPVRKGQTHTVKTSPYSSSIVIDGLSTLLTKRVTHEKEENFAIVYY
jgi:hypothetical protein